MLKDITWSFGNENARFRHEQWREVFEMQLESTPFTIQSADPLFSLPLGEESVAFTQWLSPEAIWDRYRSKRHFLGFFPPFYPFSSLGACVWKIKHALALKYAFNLENLKTANIDSEVV